MQFREMILVLNIRFCEFLPTGVRGEIFIEVGKAFHFHVEHISELTLVCEKTIFFGGGG